MNYDLYTSTYGVYVDCTVPAAAPIMTSEVDAAALPLYSEGEQPAYLQRRIHFPKGSVLEMLIESYEPRTYERWTEDDGGLPEWIGLIKNDLSEHIIDEPRLKYCFRLTNGIITLTMPYSSLTIHSFEMSSEDADFQALLSVLHA